MERELSMGAELAIGLIFFSALLSVVVFTVSIGMSMKDSSAQTVGDIEQSMAYNYVTELSKSDEQKDMPAATAYNIVTMYRDVITQEVSGYDDSTRNLQYEDSVLKANLKGRVYLDLKAKQDGTYVAIIHILDRDGNYADLTTNGINNYLVANDAILVKP